MQESSKMNESVKMLESIKMHESIKMQDSRSTVSSSRWTYAALAGVSEEALREMLMTAIRESTNDPALFLENLETFSESTLENMKKVQRLVEFEMIESFLETEDRRRHKFTRDAMQARFDDESTTAKSQGSRTRNYEGLDQGHRDKLVGYEMTWMRRAITYAKAYRRAAQQSRDIVTSLRVSHDRLHRTRRAALVQIHNHNMRVLRVKHIATQLDSRISALDVQHQEQLLRTREFHLDQMYSAQMLEEMTCMDASMAAVHQMYQMKEDMSRRLMEKRIDQALAKAELGQKHEKIMGNMSERHKEELDGLVNVYQLEDDKIYSDDRAKEDRVEAMDRRRTFERGNGEYGENEGALITVGAIYEKILWSTGIFDDAGSSDILQDYGSSDLAGEEDNWDSDCVIQTVPEDEAGTVTESHNPVVMSHRRGSNLSANLSARAASDTGEESVAQRDDVKDDVKDDVTCRSNDVFGVGRQWQAASSMGLSKMKQDQKKEKWSEKEKQKQELESFWSQNSKEMLIMKREMSTAFSQAQQEFFRERKAMRQKMNDRLKRLEQEQIQMIEAMEQAYLKNRSLILDSLQRVQMTQAEVEAGRRAVERENKRAQALISAQVFHEVRNALSAITSMSDIVQDLQMSNEMDPAEVLNTVSSTVSQSSEVVSYTLSVLNNVLDVSKISSGQVEIRRTTFDIYQLLERAVHMHSPRLKPGVRLDMSSLAPDTNKILVRTDADIVMRLLVNFLSNAVKFTSSGAIEAFLLPISDSYVAAGVADTGCGLSKEIFNSSRDHVSTSLAAEAGDPVRNSGFGLHLAHLLAAALKTSLRLEPLSSWVHRLGPNIGEAYRSKHSGRGTVIYFPLSIDLRGSGSSSDGTETANDTVSSMESVSTNSDALIDGVAPTYRFEPRGSLRVLIVDDLCIIRKGIMRSLARVLPCAVEFETAISAEEMMRLVREKDYDIVVSDHSFTTDFKDAKRLQEGEQKRIFSIKSGEGWNEEYVGEFKRFFAEESFYIRPGDGELGGRKAITSMVNDGLVNQRPYPLFILSSGHSLPMDLPGVIVLQKPFRADEAVVHLETHASFMMERAPYLFSEQEGEEDTSLVNCRGVQIFKKPKGGIMSL